MKIVLALITGIFCHLAWAGESSTKLLPDPKVDFKTLDKSQKVHIDFIRKDTLFLIDSSAVLRVSADKFFKSVTSYKQFARFGLPGIKTSHVLSIDDNKATIWYKVRSTGIKSFHCNVVTSINRSNTDKPYYATTWKLTACPKKNRQTDLPKEYQDKPSFEQLSGSFFIQPLKKGKDGKPRTYVRYVIHSKVKSIIPKTILYWIAKYKVKKDTLQAIRIYEKEAKKL
jgi:hypothetical protein